MTDMENKIRKSIFESDFDSFELDDGFLLKVDGDLRKHKINRKDSSVEKITQKTVYKSEVIHIEHKTSEKKTEYDGISLFLEDLNESDFFEHTFSKNKKNSCKVTNDVPSNEESVVVPNEITCCLSPVLGPHSKSNINKSFSSTPIRSKNCENPEEKHKTKEPDENIKQSENIYLEADLFDDWGTEMNSQKDSITLSQAFKLIEEAESARQSGQKEELNTSIDLLTGKPIGADLEDLFTESFTLPNSVEKKPKREEPGDCVILFEEFNAEKKPLAAQKLNFETKIDNNIITRKNSFGSYFSSDDDFDFLTQELLKKPKCGKNLTQSIGFSPVDSTESIRRGKCCRIIESDSAEDSPDEKLRKSRRKIRGQNDLKRNAAREFIESEAEVSDVVEVSSDELEEEENYDSSFVDEELYLTQNLSADMTAKYLESVKNRNLPGQFKIPVPKPCSPDFVFSQVPEDNNTDYELDSFCVSEVGEEEMKTELSDLEIAENILEMDRKKKKRKRTVQQS